ncbi:MAG: hypothetical protein ACT4OU_04310 [Hyphomicrobium sp.]
MSFAGVMQFLWPVLVSATAWGIAIWALREPDVHSDIVKRLIGEKPERPTIRLVNQQEKQP